MKRSCITVALLLAAGTVAAQNRTTEQQARSYIQSAFITGVAHAIISPDVVLGPLLRDKLALPPGADRDRIYEAIFALTEEKTLRVRQASHEEAAGIGVRAAGRPVYALEGGATPLVLVYDLDRNVIPYVALLGAQSVTGSTAAPTMVQVAETTPQPARSAPPPTVIRLKPVSFRFNDATLTSEAKAQLEGDGLPKIVAIREVRYVVQGHADRLGTAAYNQRLSERRARAVRGYLVEKGVPAEQIQAVGLGASMPQTSCEQKNRRVTVEIEPPPL